MKCIITYFDWVGQWESDGQRETFGHGDDQYGDTDNEKLDKVVKVLVLPWLVFVDKSLDAKRRDQNNDRQDGDSGTCTPQRRQKSNDDDDDDIAERTNNKDIA